MQKYNKAIIAGVALGIFLLKDLLNYDLSAQADNIVEVVLAIGGTLAVYAIPNKPDSTPTPTPVTIVQ